MNPLGTYDTTSELIDNTRLASLGESVASVNSVRLSSPFMHKDGGSFHVIFMNKLPNDLPAEKWNAWAAENCFDATTNDAKLIMNEDYTIDIVILNDHIPWKPWDTCLHLVLFVCVDMFITL